MMGGRGLGEGKGGAGIKGRAKVGRNCPSVCGIDLAS